MFILNISVEQTKFQYSGGSISNRNLTIAHSIDIYDSGQCKVIHPSSDLHVFSHPRNSKKYMYTDSRIYEDIFGVFYRKLNVATLSKKNFEVFTAFYDIHIVKLWQWGTWVLQMSLIPSPHVKMN